MKTNKPILQLIQERVSCRTYDPNPIPQAKIEEMTRFIEGLNSDAQSHVRFALTNSVADDPSKPIKMGSYGIISGASTYMIAISKIDSGDALELGYLFEKAILKATDLDLGTVWMGGTFDRKAFEKQLGLKDDEILSIVSPLGTPKQKRSLMDSAIRFGAGSNARKPWDQLFFDHDFRAPLTRSSADEYAMVLDMVRVGPSASNKQPWRLLKTDGHYHLYLERTPGYAQLMRYDLQLNDVGIAKCHFELSCDALGLKGTWVVSEQPVSDPSRIYVLSWRILG